jgi:hypothetical protein
MLRLRRPRAGPGGPNPRGKPLPLPRLSLSLPFPPPRSRSLLISLSLRLLIARADRCLSCRWGQVTVAFNKDPSPIKVNLGVGAYRTEVRRVWINELLFIYRLGCWRV